MALNSTASMGTNNNTNAFATLKEPNTASKLNVVASFYPILQFVNKIGGNRADVSSLIPLVVEPHDFEPTIQQVQNAERADMLVYNGAGFEGPWIKRINAKFAVDSSQGLNLTESSDEQPGNNNERADRRDDKAKGTFDPHIYGWILY
jgi:zinc transport system substrate-binding protein